MGHPGLVYVISYCMFTFGMVAFLAAYDINDYKMLLWISQKGRNLLFDKLFSENCMKMKTQERI